MTLSAEALRAVAELASLAAAAEDDPHWACVVVLPDPEGGFNRLVHLIAEHGSLGFSWRATSHGTVGLLPLRRPLLELGLVPPLELAPGLVLLAWEADS